MKRILLFGLTTFFYLTTHSQIPDLALRTLKGELRPSDFEDQKYYMVNIDTIQTKTSFLSDDIVFYNTKFEMIEKIDKSLNFLKNKNVDYFIDLQDNSIYYPRKQHWYMLVGDYRIDWWFSAKDPTKLETITLIK